MKKASSRALRAGFTLIELLIIIVIMGILSASTFALFRSGEDEAAEAKTQKVIQAMANLVEMYTAKFGHYPEVASESMAFEVILRDDSCSACGAKKNDTSATFGLASNFIGKATVLTTQASDRISSFNKEIKSSDGDAPSGWETAFREWAGETNPIESCARYEAGSTEMEDLKTEWKRLMKEDVVEEGYYGCAEHKCNVSSYKATAKADGWGRALKYRTAGGGYEIISAGPDGRFDTSDDLTSQGNRSKTNTKKSDEGMYD
jgi:prepilin-type N-terminal cleavage/methylation domain-containing protein